MTKRPDEERVLLLAPTPRDSAMTRQVFAGVGVTCTPCATVEALCAQAAAGAGAVVITEHVLALPDIAAFTDLLRRQPPWSDLPVVVLASGGGDSPMGRRAIELFGNVTVLERPVQMASLASVVRTLIRSRRRQYQIRQHLLERERAKDDAQRSLAQWRAVVESMAEGLVLADADGNLLMMNPVALAIHEFASMQDMLRRLGDYPGLFELRDTEGRVVPLEQWPLSRALRGERFNGYEVQVHRRDTGRTWTGSYGGTAVRDEAGRVTLAVLTMRDITEQRRLAEERARLLEAERAARNEAERVSRVKDEFLATLSHELRTPLNAILGWSQILARQGGPRDEADLAEGLRTIERNARAQTQIIEDLLDMSRIINGKVRLDVQRVELPPVIEAALETVRPAADAKEIRVQKVLDPSAGFVSGDPSRLQQVFWNLLSNAIKFTPRGGRVQVVLERVDSHVEVAVSDTGEGIRPEFLPHVFDRFRQADASPARRHGGLGLGLAIARQLVELHGGTIRATSAGPGRGSSFVVTLPPTVVHPEPEPPRRHPTAARPAHAGNGECVMPEGGRVLEGVRVLVVDDEPDARALVRRLLEDCGATVVTAASAAEAFDLFRTEPPTVLVSDIGMPGDDGHALIGKVRALDRHRGGDTPAVALTAYARSEDRTRAIQHGFQMHVAKPVEPAELVTIVAALARRASGAAH